jgi:hypothetical protein
MLGLVSVIFSDFDGLNMLESSVPIVFVGILFVAFSVRGRFDPSSRSASIPSPHGDSGKDRWRQSLEGKGCERS